MWMDRALMKNTETLPGPAVWMGHGPVMASALADSQASKLAVDASRCEQTLKASLVVSFLDDYAQLCNIPVTGRRQPYGRDALVDFSEQYAPEADPYFIQDRKQTFPVTLTLNCGSRLAKGFQNVVLGTH